MGKKAKGSRKGKKAWRANISTEDIEDFFEKSTKDALSGGSLSELPNNSIFYVDESKDLSVKRKIEKHREKVLQSYSVLQKNSFVQAVPSSKSKQKKLKKKQKNLSEAINVTQDGSTNETASTMVDIWANEGETDKKSMKVSKPSDIPAVEVDLPGCSYNPSFESHQDSLAIAVAEEMQKIYQDELGPEPVPVIVPGKALNEEDRYFLEVDNQSDDEEDVGNLNENEAEDRDRSMKSKRLTKVELNKRAKRKELERKEAESKRMENISKQIDSLPDLLKEIEEENNEKKRRRERRLVAKQERLKVRPPRLGKHKFEPAPTQVLLSEEITGSLRKLKACCTLVKDRYKSIEKRGLVVPVKSKRN